MQKRIIMHIDLDYFYAQIEEVLNPKLKGRPVAVGADPKHGSGRGVVSTSNYEARKFGVKSGLPIAIAYRKCPNCIFLPVQMELYVKVSVRIMNIFKKFADEFEVGGIDECYLNVSERCKNYGSAKKLAETIKAELKQKENLTCSIGVGPNKLIAKIAAGRQKPDGVTIVKPDEVKEFLKKLSVRELLGVGPKTEAVLNQMNIFTIGQLAKVSKAILVDTFGKFGFALYDEARGIDESPVAESSEVKSIGRQVTFEKDTRDKKLILATLDEIISDAVKQLRELKLNYKTITIKIRYEDFYTTSKAKTLKVARNDKKAACDVAHELIKEFLSDERNVRLIGFSLSGFN